MGIDAGDKSSRGEKDGTKISAGANGGTLSSLFDMGKYLFKKMQSVSFAPVEGGTQYSWDRERLTDRDRTRNQEKM